MFYYLKRDEVKIVFLFLIAVLFFYFRFLDGKIVFAFKDLSRYFYPLRYLMVEEVRAGRIPLWNPYIFCGFPLLATFQIGFFYPLTIIHYFLPFNLAFNYYLILHYFLAACFMYILLRHWQLGKFASFFGGIVFTFSGYLLSVSNMNTSLSSVIWLPLVVWACDSFLLKPSLRFFVLLAVFEALMLLGGEPTIFYTTFWFLLAYSLVFAQRRGFSVTVLLLATLLALGLSAVQLFPFLELSRFSDRVVMTQFEVVSFRSFPIREIITFVLPYFFGNPAQFGGYTETLLGKTYQDWLISPYLGIIPLLLAFFSFQKDKKRSAFFAAAAIVGLFLAFGKYTPVYRLAYHILPGISLIRYPVKFLFLTNFCLVALASLGFEALSVFSKNGEVLRKLMRVLVLVFGVGLALSLTGFLFINKIYAFLAQGYSSVPKDFLDLLKEIISFNLQSIFNSSIYLLAVIVLIYLVLRNKVSKTIFMGCLIFLVIVDLMANGASIALGIPVEVFKGLPDNFKILKADQSLFRFFYTSDLEEKNRIIYGESYEEALWNAKDNFAANWHIPHHLFDFSGYESIKPWALSNFMRQSLRGEKLKSNLRFLSFYNVKYIASTKRIFSPSLKLLRHKRKYGIDLYLYENKKVFPRAYLLDRTGNPSLKMGKVVIEKYLPGEILIKVNTRVSGLLFLSESYYPGWRAKLDGKEAEIAKADNLFMAVKVPPGKHLVRFVYLPKSFKFGAFISAFCFLLSVFLFSGVADGIRTRDPQSHNLML